MEKVTGFCVRCKVNGREMKGVSIVEMKPGRFAAKGKCVVCDTGMYKILNAADADRLKKAA